MIRVVVADGSIGARTELIAALRADGAFDVVGEAADGAGAVRLVGKLRPDVVAMDLDLPGVSGLEAARRIMRECPTPVVLVAAHASESDAARAVKALEAGALAVVGRPPPRDHPEYAAEAARLARTVRVMAGVRVVRRRDRLAERPRATARPDRRLAPDVAAPVKVIGMAASTGGPAALGVIFGGLPADFAVPILLVQHIASGFDRGFASWLDSVTPLTVEMASAGRVAQPGHVYVAPEDVHLGITAGLRIRLSDEPPIRGHRPAATHLFRSLAKVARDEAAGVILTGMGDDGVAGLLELHSAGGVVLAQDEETSVVFGMPGEAVARGAADRVVPLEKIAGVLLALCMRRDAAP